MGLTFKKPANEAGKAWPGILVGLFVAFGGILYGYDTGNISGILAMPYVIDIFGNSTDEAGARVITSGRESVIVSVLSIGTFIGALAAPFLGDTIGRRWGLIVSTLIFNVGVIMQTAATSVPLFTAGRFFAGAGVGFVSSLVPLYQSETAPKWIRGLIVGSYQFAITIGILLAAVVNNATKDRNDTGSYRIPVAIQFAWSLILCIGMLILPETPRFYIKQGKSEQAAKSLSWLRRLDGNDPAVREELSEIQASLDHERTVGNGSYLDVFGRKNLPRLLTGMGTQMFQQLSGINFIFYYGTNYFKNSGMSNPFVISMITSCINVATTLPGIWFTDKVGRRKLLLFGAMGMTVSHLLVALLGMLTTHQTDLGVVVVENVAAQKAGIAFICIFIAFFASTWGPIPWVVCSEIFPLQTRAKSLSVTAATNWLINWALAFSTPHLVNWGPTNANLQSKIFFIWFGCCLLACVFVYFCVYETKNLSLEEVDQLYNEISTARKSPGWTPSYPVQPAVATGNSEKGSFSHENGNNSPA